MSLPDLAKVTMGFQVSIPAVGHSLLDSSPSLSPKNQFSSVFYIAKHHILLKWHFH